MSTPARIGVWSLAAFLLAAAAGCGGNSFVGQRYNNFTAYYNTFYNARQAYEGGVRAMESTTEPVDRTRYLPVFGSPGRAGGNVAFQNAIDKSADLLRQHPSSKWVDDALLLIGKSYFYQGNYVGAEQKFREVVDLETGLEDESRIWLARTLIAAGAYEDARDHLMSSLDQEDLSERWAPRLHIALGELYVRQEEYADAAAELVAGLEEIHDNEIEAKAAFLLGQVNETLENYEAAVEAYRRVRSAHPRYELSYAADLSAVRVQGLYLDPDAALNELRRMERDDKNYQNRFELAYIRGRIYQEQGRVAEARSLYRNILYEAGREVPDLHGRLHYALAELYRDAFSDYTVAAAHFDTARTSLTSGSGARPSGGDAAPNYSPEAITDVDYQADVYSSFADVRTRVARMDSLLELGSLDDEAFQERLLEIRRQKAIELAEQQRRAEQLQAERGFQDAAARTSNRSTSSAAQSAGQEGFLSHRDPVRVQEARMNFISQWGDRPLVPNWRRIEAVAAATADAQDQNEQPGVGMRGVDPEVGAGPLPQIDYSDVPRDSLSRARLKAERALARYELGNVLFLSMNRPDSAAAWYRKVVDEDAAEVVAQRAFYALAEVQRSLGDTAAANRLYEQVLRDFPNSDFAGRVREQMGIEETNRSDSLSRAFAEYDAAFERWREGRYGAALDSMAAVAARHSRTEVAPKALLAAGRIYLEWADADSMDVFAPLPFTVPDSVLKQAGLLQDAEAPSDTAAVSGPAGEGEATPPAEADMDIGPDGDLPAPEGAETFRRRVEVDGEDAAATAEERRPAPGASEERVPADRRSESETAGRSQEAVPGRRPEVASDSTKLLDARADTTGAALADADTTGAVLADADTSAPDAPLAGADTSASDAALAAADTSAAAAALAGADTSAAAAALAAADGSTSDRARADTSLSEAVPGDSAALAEPPNTLDGEAPDAADAETLIAMADDDAVYLQSLYASVQDRYPSTPYAEQASSMLDALERRLREMEEQTVDSTDGPSILAAVAMLGAAGSLLPDSLVAGAGDDVLEDRSLADGPPNAEGSDPPSGRTLGPGGDVGAVSAEESRGREARSNASNEESAAPGIRGDGEITIEMGGFTIVLSASEDRAKMEELAARYAQAGYRTDVVELSIAGMTVYRAVLGHFDTEKDASLALEAHRDEISEQVQVAPLKRR